jgi:hypothetical protein
MSHVVTERRDDARTTRLLPYVVEALVVVAVFAVVGAGAGWLWFQVWTQPTGVAVGHVWYPDEEGLRDVFDGTAWYVLLAVAGGLLVGGMATLLGRRAPLVTMVAVIAGSVLASWLMLEVGLMLSPEDPETLAKTATDYTELRGRLTLEGGHSPYLAWPFGALLAAMVLNFLLSSREQIKAREATDPRWLSPDRSG